MPSRQDPSPRDPALFDEFEYQGLWWLPDQPEARIAGTVSVNSEGRIALDLIGSLRAEHAFEHSDVFQPPIVLGLTARGKWITLYNNFELRSSSSFPGLTTSRLHSHFVLIGKHFNSPADIMSRCGWIGYTDLETWMSQNPFSNELHAEGNRLVGSSARYSRPTPCEAPVPSLDASISADYAFHQSGTLFTSFLWTHSSELKVTPAVPMPLDWYLRVIRDLANLLALLVGRPVYPTRVTLAGDTVEIAPGRTTTELVNVFYGFPGTRPEGKPLSPHDVLVPLPAIQSNLDIVLQRWFDRAEVLRPVYDLFFGSWYNKALYLDSHFLTLAQALESFHRRTRRGIYVEPDVYARYCDTIVQAIPQEAPHDLRDALSARLRYGNEHSQRRRFRELLDALDDRLCAMVTRDAAAFVGRVVATRNYLTHYDEESRAEAWHGADLLYPNQRLRVLLSILLLQELSLDAAVVADAVSRSDAYRLVAEQDPNG